MDIKPALKPFPGVREDEIFRLIGPVDILIGIQNAAIHPTTIEVSGNLRLLKTIFSTGKLVDGNSDSIHSEPVFMDKESFALSHGTVDKCNFESGRTKVTNFISARNKNFNFLECEGIRVGQPKRCAGCSNCKVCSMKYQEMSRKDHWEFEMIRSNMELDTDRKQVSFASYPFC